jgi:hypothetical protein
LPRQRDVKGSAFVELGFRPNAAVVFLDGSFHERQAYAVARELGFALELLEDLKEFIGVFHVEANAIIANPKNLFAILHVRSELDFRLRLLLENLSALETSCSKAIRKSAVSAWIFGSCGILTSGSGPGFGTAARTSRTNSFMSTGDGVTVRSPMR